ncbi:radical SAM protein [Thermotoga sp. KOL6]|uniref:radical SAM protein n=1 Tax=Thermotoga sp. KOL6 TaxID=126741 RepID=UPI000C777AC3|nr:radical SAM protein [Thermotoga sp. KOL6]PLV58727.1 radical SAM protein [Thermotoga sp. KOL6]
MKIIKKIGKEEIAYVYLGETSRGNLVEFVESVQPPIPREEKWVLIVSTLVGCPIGCLMCDAGGFYKGKLSSSEIFEQIDYLVKSRYQDKKIPAKKFKIQFARMGEPSLNESVIEVLEELPARYHAPGLLPSLSTVAPKGTDAFFEKLLSIKRKHYTGRFQLQFSIHSTDEKERDRIIPVRKWSLEKIAEYGEEFVEETDRKITLNFAVAQSYSLDAKVIIDRFDPRKFLVKITPVNPTYRSKENKLKSDVDVERHSLMNHQRFVDELRKAGFEVILSIGELEENKIGSNCGQYVQRHLISEKRLEEGYEYV